jgi:hypothetical protein
MFSLESFRVISIEKFLQKVFNFSVSYIKSFGASYLLSPKHLTKINMANHSAQLQSESNVPHLKLEQIRIHPKLKEFLLPHSESEAAILEEDILFEGRVREKLLLWQSSEGEYFILDGHLRFEVLKRYAGKGINWEYEVVGQFGSIHELKWRITRQKLGRQNLTPYMQAYMRGRMYEEVKKEPYRPKGQPQARGKTKYLLAAEYKVSAATIERNAAFFKGVNRFTDFYWEGENIKEKILRQESIFNKSDLEIIGKLKPISPELLYRYKQLIGNFEDLLGMSADKRVDFILAFCERFEDLSDPEQTEIYREKEEYGHKRSQEYEGNHRSEIELLIARAATPPLLRCFEKWVEQQSRQISQIMSGKSKSSLESKRQELSYCLEQISGLMQTIF